MKQNEGVARQRRKEKTPPMLIRTPQVLDERDSEGDVKKKNSVAKEQWCKEKQKVTAKQERQENLINKKIHKAKIVLIY